jgi:hypothetical protein
VIGYKGFDENLQCCGFQYEIGGEYQHDGKVAICEQGFHFCKNPLDVLSYYAPGTSRFAKVEGSGDTDRMPYEDSKVACSHLKVVAELTLRDLIQAGVEFVLETAAAEGAAATAGPGTHAVTTDDVEHAVTAGLYAHAATTGPYAHAATTGPGAHAVTAGNHAHAVTAGPEAHAATTGCDAHAVTAGGDAHAATTGDYAHAVTAGDRAHAAATGKESIAAGLGVAGRAKGALGCWLVLAEYKWTEGDGYRIAAVKAARVDGKRIKPDTWYELKGGRFVKAAEDEEYSDN